MTTLSMQTSTLNGRIPMTQEVYAQLRADLERVDLALDSLRDKTADHHDEDGRELFVAETGRELEQLSRRWERLDEILRRAEVVPADGMIVVGSRVVVRDGDDRDEEYVLVAPGEADLRAGRISIDSPLGRALFGRRGGETTEVSAPAGTRAVTVIQVHS